MIGSWVVAFENEIIFYDKPLEWVLSMSVIEILLQIVGTGSRKWAIPNCTTLYTQIQYNELISTAKYI